MDGLIGRGQIVVAIGLLTTGAAPWVYSLVRFWGIHPEYADRLLILVVSGGIIWRQRRELMRLPRRPSRWGYPLLAVGAVAFPCGWYLQAQVAPKPILLWWLATAWLGLCGGFVLLTAGNSHLRRLAFPLLFVLLALPIPNRILLPLQHLLQTLTTELAAYALSGSGVPVERLGFVLRLPQADLGVAEACSGVRSVTAMLAVAAFVAYWQGLSLPRGATLFVLTIPLIAAVNAGRVILSGWLCESLGPQAVAAWRHDALGVAMILLGVAAIVAISRLLQAGGGRSVPAIPPTGSGQPATPPRGVPTGISGQVPIPAAARPDQHVQIASVILVAAAAATLLAHVLGYREQEDIQAAAPLVALPLQWNGWFGQGCRVPEELRHMLTPDDILHRTYVDTFGHEWNVWVIYWSSQNMVKGYHHPDICWPNRGYTLQRRTILELSAGGGRLPVTEREFCRGTERWLIWYWTQEGQRVWSEADERRAQLLGDSHAWVAERLWGAAPTVRGRLTVLVATPVWGDGRLIRLQSQAFLVQLAHYIYELCPWAAPPQSD